ncbi:MAG: acyltransferase family protein [Myxococcota bacterium]
MSDAVPPTGRRYFPELESLRGIAILLVVVFHAYHFRAFAGYEPAPLPLFVGGGHTGVSLFFVLSAFLLVRPYLVEAAGGRPVDRRRFLARRWLRIVPLYAGFVAAAVLFSPGGSTVDRLWPALTSLLFFHQGDYALFPFSTPWWSLVTEAQFYLALPILSLACRGPRGRAVFLVGVALYAAVYLVLVTVELPPAIRPGGRFWHSFPGRGPVFLFGVAAAWLHLRHGEAWERRVAASGRGVRLAFDAAVVLGIAALGGLLHRIAPIPYFELEVVAPYWHVPEGLVWSALLLVAVVGRFHLRPLFVNPLLHRLGVVSYSLYLWHCPVLFFGMSWIERVAPGVFADDAPTRLPLFAALIAAAWALSELTYRFVEAPVLRKKDTIR